MTKIYWSKFINLSTLILLFMNVQLRIDVSCKTIAFVISEKITDRNPNWSLKPTKLSRVARFIICYQWCSADFKFYQQLKRVKILTFMPSQRETARRGRSARSVRNARKAPMLPYPTLSANKLSREIYNKQNVNVQIKIEKCNICTIIICKILMHQLDSFQRIRALFYFFFCFYYFFKSFVCYTLSGCMSHFHMILI